MGAKNPKRKSKADPEGLAERRAAAARYKAWVTEHMEAKGWSGADLARAAGISESILTGVLAGTAENATAWQYSKIAHAFDVEPNEIFNAVGFWEMPRGMRVPAYWMSLYGDLSEPAREIALEHLHLVRRLEEKLAQARESEDGTLQARLDQERDAAYDNLDPGEEEWPTEQR